VGLPALAPGATAQFQTCIAADGSVDRVLDAEPALSNAGRLSRVGPA